MKMKQKIKLTPKSRKSRKNWTPKKEKNKAEKKELKMRSHMK
jgi:hypothetical protein